ncbi:MAG: hypothetical protein WBD99_14725 [Thermodesulfobacteriota bacterium]
MAKKINERYVSDSLRHYLTEHKILVILDNERQLPLPRGGYKSCRPDIIVASKKGKKLYIIECKKGSNLRSIGHAFGQLYVDELIIQRIKQADWLKFIKKRINADVSHKPDLIFAVAFHENVTKDKHARKVVKEFTKKFERYGVFLVKNKKRVFQKRNLI